MKNSRPTPDIAITQDCSSSGIKNFNISNSADFLHLLRFIFTVLYCYIGKNVEVKKK